MATAVDGATPYQSGGAGGKLRKKPIRRSVQATPYDRPPTALRNNSLFAKLVDPASRLIYAGADRLVGVFRIFGVFRKRLPSIAAPRLSETGEDSTDKGGNLASITEMLKHKTLTRSEIEQLTALLHAKTANSDGDEGEMFSPPSLRVEASSSTSSKHVEEREKEEETINANAAISTPVVTSRAFEEEVASPAEVARGDMGSRTPKSTLRFGSQDSVTLNTTTILPKTPITSLTPRTAGTFEGYENGLTTPRSRGRSAIYSMSCTPYDRTASTFSQKDLEVDDDRRSNGHVFGQNTKPETSVFVNKDVSAEVHKASPPQVDKIPEAQKIDDAKFLPKTEVHKKVTFNFSASNNTQPTVLPQITAIAASLPSTTTASAPSGVAPHVAKSSFGSFGGTVPSSYILGSFLCGSSAPAFSVANSETKSSSAFTSTSTSSFGLNSAWQPPQSTTPTTAFPFEASASPDFFRSYTSTMFPFTVGPSPSPSQMSSREDSMAEDSTPTPTPTPTPSPSPSVPAFGQPSSGGFMFGSAARHHHRFRCSLVF